MLDLQKYFVWNQNLRFQNGERGALALSFHNKNKWLLSHFHKPLSKSLGILDCYHEYQQYTTSSPSTIYDFYLSVIIPPNRPRNNLNFSKQCLLRVYYVAVRDPCTIYFLYDLFWSAKIKIKGIKFGTAKNVSIHDLPCFDIFCALLTPL